MRTYLRAGDFWVQAQERHGPYYDPAGPSDDWSLFSFANT